jgi:hypothetical protein
MLRLDGGEGRDSSTLRSRRRARSRPGAPPVPPAPAPVPVDRFVGMGFVGPFTLRPVSGVCESVSSRPLPPSRGFGFGFGAVAFPSMPGRRVDAAARFGEALFTAEVRRETGFALAFLDAERPAAGVRFEAALVRADARVPAVFVAGVCFCRFVEPFRAEPAAFRFAAFLAIVIDPRSGPLRALTGGL